MPVPELTVKTDTRGRVRVSWKGRKGFPVMLRKDETPEQAYERTIVNDAAKAADEQLKAKAGAADPTPSLPGAGAGAGADDERARPPGSDPRPRGGRPAGKPRPSDTELMMVWAEILSMPAIPMGMPVRDENRDRLVAGAAPDGSEDRTELGFRPRCEFCRDHFIQQGPLAAAELVKMSRESDPIRQFLERIATVWGGLSAGAALAAYAAKPLMHHLAPEQALDAFGPVLGVPPRPESLSVPRRPHRHPHAPAAPAGAGAPAGA